MCYVPAEGRSRDAREDEVLLVSIRPHGSKWLVSPDDTSTAVCLKEGTEVELLYIPEDTQRRFELPREAKGIFKMNDWWRRDVFVLQNGRKVPLKKLQPGQVVRVLSGLAASDPNEVPRRAQNTDGIVEGSNRRHTFKKYPSGSIGASEMRH